VHEASKYASPQQPNRVVVPSCHTVHRAGGSQCYLPWANPAQAKGISLGEVRNSRGLSGDLPRVHQPYVFGLDEAIKILANLAAARLSYLAAG
jgi:hypothetical protein